MKSSIPWLLAVKLGDVRVHDQRQAECSHSTPTQSEMFFQAALLLLLPFSLLSPGCECGPLSGSANGGTGIFLCHPGWSPASLDQFCHQFMFGIIKSRVSLKHLAFLMETDMKASADVGRMGTWADVFLVLLEGPPHPPSKFSSPLSAVRAKKDNSSMSSVGS